MHWVALETANALPRAEIKRLVKISYDLVFTKLPKKTQAELARPLRRRAQPGRGR